MSNARLPEVLGVEVNEVFEFRMDSRFEPKKLYVSENGDLHYAPVSESSELVELGLLMNVINYPERITHVPHIQRWTKKDVEDAKAVKQLLGGDLTVKAQEDSYGKIAYINDGNDYFNIYLRRDCFPSLERGGEANIDDILKADVAE